VKVFGFEIARVKAQTLTAVNSMRGWFSLIGEAWGGAWQQNVTVDSPKDILAFSGTFAPVTLIACDVAKMRVKLVEEDDDGICTEIKTQSPFLAVLRKPNQYQNRIKFIEQWIISKLLYGNTYVLKGREKVRGVVNALYVLDAYRVTPLVAENGDVYYELSRDDLSKLNEKITVPASEIIHDRMNCLWHPLVGVSPIYACGLSATMGRKIQANSTKFFDNMSRPSGVLTAPGAISDEVAARLKKLFEENFSGNNIGRLMVGGDGLKYEPMTIPAEQAQLIEQLRWTVEDVARCFHMPLFKVGGPVPVGSTIPTLQQIYYSDCLQSLIEDLEICLDEGLELPADYYAECDLEGLLRMDATDADDDARRGREGQHPRSGRGAREAEPQAGAWAAQSPMAQQQNYSLAALAKRDASDGSVRDSKAPRSRAASRQRRRRRRRSRRSSPTSTSRASPSMHAA
jgi:HK97 family phage portal protein